MTPQEINNLMKQAEEAIKSLDWAETMAKKLLPLMKMDLSGGIDLYKELTETVPFFTVHRDSTGKVSCCTKLTDRHCKTCILRKDCLFL